MKMVLDDIELDKRYHDNQMILRLGMLRNQSQSTLIGECTTF